MLGLTDVSMQCYLDNRAEISWKFQLMQQQNQKLQQEKSKLLSQKNSIAEATPWKPFNELSSRQSRRREKQAVSVAGKKSQS